MDGLPVLKKVANGWPKLSYRDPDSSRSLVERVEGVDAGAGDYLTKPFAMEKLLARMRALLRRGSDLKGRLIYEEDFLEMLQVFNA